jgi:GNAT superfamily N-acetyltransferase
MPGRRRQDHEAVGKIRPMGSATWDEVRARRLARSSLGERVPADGLVEVARGIVVFGLVAEFVGRGFGGAFLTLATDMAWRLTSRDGRPTKRVLVQTSSRDHPHALPNYERRGFWAFHIERRCQKAQTESE